MPPLVDLTNQLVAHLAPSLTSDQQFYAAEYVLKELQSPTKGSTRREWSDVESTLRQAQRSARVRVQDDLADALEKCLSILGEKKGQGGWEGDMPIQMSNIPQHIQLLINLSTPPSTSTQTWAKAYLGRKVRTGPTSDELLYCEIMSDPFEGEHWGKGHDEEVKHGWTDSETEFDSDSSSSVLEDEAIVTPLTERIVGGKRDEERRIREEKLREGERRLEVARKALEELEMGYWRTGGRPLAPRAKGIFGWKALTTESLTAALSADIDDAKKRVEVVSSDDLQRELLFALSGRSGVFLRVEEDSCKINEKHPQVTTYSEAALGGILIRTAHRASQTAQLRLFIRKTCTEPPSPQKVNKTREAFAGACQTFMKTFDNWISEIELATVRGTTSTSDIPSTALSLCQEVASKFGAALNDLVNLLTMGDNGSQLLDTIYAMYTSTSNSAHKQHLLDVFSSTAEPMWNDLSKWINEGMPLPSAFSADVDHIGSNLDDDEESLDLDFFIRRDRDVSWTDEDFWENGYVIGNEGWPEWMGDTQDMILEAGKAKGLLRGLLGRVDRPTMGPSLKSLFEETMSDSTQPADIPLVLRDHLLPTCQITIFQLRRVLEEDCGLEQHLDAIEGAMYLSGHDATDRWSSGLYDQIREGKRWHDMQSLTSSFRDALEESRSTWMNPSAIRVLPAKKHRSTVSMDSASIKLAKSLGGLQISYNAPFPLSVLFTPTSLALRSEVFGFLMLLNVARRAVQGAIARRNDSIFWPTLHLLSWVLDTIWTWITQRVIQVQSEAYRARLTKTSNLKEMIHLELDHTRRIRDYCFLHDHMSEIRDHIEAIAAMALSLCISDEQGIDDFDLRNRVEVVRREIEILARSGGPPEEEEERRAVWAMLSFALEDWR